jgi:hypothetical protein
MMAAMAIRHLALFRLLRDENLPASLWEPQEFRETVEGALDPEIQVLRYRRVWRLSAPHVIENRWLWGKLGFQQSVSAESTYYDDTNHDFVTRAGAAEAAFFSHYVLDLENQYMLFELRPPDIRMQSFAGAFQAILDESIGNRLQLEPVPDTSEFFEWLREVDSVTSLHISLRRANPNFDGRPEGIRSLLEATNAARLDIDAKSGSPDQPLQVENTDLATYVEYAGDGYGAIRAQGRQGDKVRAYSSSRNVVQEEMETADLEDSQSIVRRIIEALQSLIR